MYTTLADLFTILNHQDNNMLILIVFLGMCVLNIFFRIVICIGYQTNYALFKLNMKELKAKSEVKNTKAALLNKIIKDFIKSADKNIAKVPTEVITHKYVVRLHFLGWSYDSMGRFVTSFEQGVVLVAAVLAIVFYEYRFLYGLLTVAVFIVIRIIAGLFDFTLLREKLSDELTEYVDREVGQFFASDSASILLRFKTEMTDGLMKQSEAIREALLLMGNDLTSMLRLSMQEMTANVEVSASKIMGYSEILQKPLSDWRDALVAAESLQVKISGGLSGMESVAEKLNAAAGSLTAVLEDYSGNVKGQIDLAREQTAHLISIAEQMQDSNHLTEKSNERFSRQLGFIEQNQSMLENSMQQYESSLEALTKRMGEGFGNIIEFHMQSSYKALNENLQQNMNRIINANNELLLRLQQLFDTMLEQSRNEAAAIMKIKEQMELYHGNH